ncbi:MAG: transporter substrate-binding protein [Rhodospirillales bacterium]|nr:transporter substrate-binding protein [Rhodospirillales bacterium]
MRLRRSLSLKPLWAVIGALVLTAAGLPATTSAKAEATDLRVSRQLGLGYLQLYVTEEQKLIEKHAKAAGLGDIKVTYLPLGNPSTINDAILSGSADIAGTGVPPFILLWDKTRNSQRVRALTALNAQPAFLNANKPAIAALKDFGPNDRIALPSVKSSFQAIILEMAAEKILGEDKRTALDQLTVSMAHPDAAAALMSGRTEITGHFTSPPFQYQELQNSGVHRVLSSYEITGPATFSVLWSTGKFHDANPKLIAAVIAAIDEATDFIKNNPDETARIFLKIEHSNLEPSFIAGLLRDPDIRYSASPENITKFSDFMNRTGSVGQKAASWKDLFFNDIQSRTGS